MGFVTSRGSCVYFPSFTTLYHSFEEFNYLSSSYKELEISFLFLLWNLGFLFIDWLFQKSLASFVQVLLCLGLTTVSWGDLAHSRKSPH
jgi:hypothetical protein